MVAFAARLRCGQLTKADWMADLQSGTFTRFDSSGVMLRECFPAATVSVLRAQKRETDVERSLSRQAALPEVQARAAEPGRAGESMERCPWRFKHRGLRRLYKRGDRSGIRPDLLATVEDLLARLDEAATPQALNLPGYRLHRLKGDLQGFWSVTVRANWRIMFRFEGTDAFDVELIDYH
jgi:proteic killer suppression protein